MTDEELTALWREAGRPWVAGMNMACGGMVSDVFGYGGLEEASVDRSGFDLVQYTSEEAALLVPDWSHPMTEFAMMCAAEKAHGGPLTWTYYGPVRGDRGFWEAEDDFAGAVIGALGSQSRTECALRVIIACLGEKGGQE